MSVVMRHDDRHWQSIKGQTPAACVQGGANANHKLIQEWTKCARSAPCSDKRRYLCIFVITAVYRRVNSYMRSLYERNKFLHCQRDKTTSHLKELLHAPSHTSIIYHFMLCTRCDMWLPDARYALCNNFHKYLCCARRCKSINHRHIFTPNL